ncbi:hypothetical protein A8M77_29945 [Variovorax sp. JS1663]|nr:hypothetical protein A8M77_29945 [Variovorax sp. JS1663]
MDRSEWLAACAHQLQRRWRTIDPEVLEDVANDLWADESLRTLPPTRAAIEWLKPLEEPEPERSRQPSPFPSNGILAKIPGADVARGAQGLPTAAKGQPEQMQAEIDVDHLGLVRITYKLTEARHRGNTSHCFWCACYAEAVG